MLRLREYSLLLRVQNVRFLDQHHNVSHPLPHELFQEGRNDYIADMPNLFALNPRRKKELDLREKLLLRREEELRERDNGNAPHDSGESLRGLRLELVSCSGLRSVFCSGLRSER